MSATFESDNALDYEGSIVSANNLTLCQQDYFKVCWCAFNSTQYTSCSYLLQHVVSSSNSSHYCVYHILKEVIECIDASIIFPPLKIKSPSNIYLYVTLILFIIGLIGNGTSMIVLLKKSLRRLSIYKNLTILCAFNILYLTAIFVRYKNGYNRDLRDVSPKACRLHSFMVAFLGHLCSWQLVSMSVQRVHALLSLETNRKTSWIRTWAILLIFVVIPVFIFDAQLLFDYGLLKDDPLCNQDPIQNRSKYSSYEIKQYQRAVKFPIHRSKLPQNILFQYYLPITSTPSIRVAKKPICILWNMCDAFIYAIIPFIITLICSIVIIVKVCERRHSTIIFGGTCHTHNRTITAQDHLSVLLIAINLLFLIMTSPFNIYLIVQSFYERCSSSTSLSVTMNEWFRSLQNSYHAFVFVFHCIIGNKFRRSAWSICRTIYYKLIELGIGRRCPQSIFVLFSDWNERRRSSASAQTMSTTINTKLSSNDIVKQMSVISRGHDRQQRKHSSFVLVTNNRPSYVSIDGKKRTIIEMVTPV